MTAYQQSIVEGVTNKTEITDNQIVMVALIVWASDLLVLAVATHNLAFATSYVLPPI